MKGSIINAAGIALGVVFALLVKKPLSAHHQSVLKVGLGALMVFFGLKLTWTSLNGSPLQIAKLLGIVLLSMILGKVIGKLLHLQKFSNRLGQYATLKISTASVSRDKFNEGFLVCTALFCAAPMAMLGAIQEGLDGFSPVLVIKAFMDGAAAMAFASIYGWGVILAAIPVLAFQGSLTRGANLLAPILQNQPWPLADALNATNGLLVFSVALIILQLKKIEVTDYLPSLVLAPLFTRLLW